jgi:hypothetical protein
VFGGFYRWNWCGKCNREGAIVLVVGDNDLVQPGLALKNDLCRILMKIRSWEWWRDAHAWLLQHSATIISYDRVLKH